MLGRIACPRRSGLQITDIGSQALLAVWPIARGTSDLQDAGLTTEESRQLSELLLKIVRATGDPPGRTLASTPPHPTGPDSPSQA